jgi:hypothetical protein
MSFPLSVDAAVTLRGRTASSSEAACVLDALEQALRARRPKQLDRSGNSLHFTPWSGLAGWHLFAPITDGVVRVQPQASSLVVEYHLSLRKMVLTTSIILLAGAAFFLWLGPPGTRVALGAVPLGWLWIVGGTFYLTSMRFASFIEQVCRLAA